MASTQQWHALPLPEIEEALACRREGLTKSEAAERRARYGSNVLPRKPPPGLGVIAARQFRNPFIYILAFAAVLSLSTGHLTDAAFIVGVLVLNALIGTVQESKAERSAQALQKLLQVRATVARDGETKEVDAEEVVPGDVVWLESGNRVPADLRLVESRGLEIDESLLTGESLACSKDPGAEIPAATPLADQVNMAHAGTIVVRGRALGITVATGQKTAVGQLALDVMGERKVKPPLILRMERFTRVVALTIVTAAVVIALISIFASGKGVTETILFAIALVVSAIPEGLPIAMTVALAVATTRMARRGLIVRKLTAVEGLGSCTYIATDKTGTLTANELTVREIVLPNGEVFTTTGEGFVPDGEVQRGGKPIRMGEMQGLDDWIRAGSLCNEGDLVARDGTWTWRGDPVDLAFLCVSHKLGLHRVRLVEDLPQVNDIPFEPERKFAATYHRPAKGGTLVAVKGAPEQILSMCSLEEPARQVLLEQAESMARRGLRVLGLAEGTLSNTIAPEDVPPHPCGLSFLGFAGMIDPLRSGTREAVEASLQAGVRVCMVTGDHRITALAIARELGFAREESEVMTGPELAALDAEALPEVIKRVNVFARVEPHQKLDIVEAARKAGHFVAVTGDGANDAPALKSAHIGVAMGKAGTDVAREAADLVISDDNFATIVRGIEEGRFAYNNIRNVIYLLVSTGAAEIVLVTLAVVFNTPLPLLPVHLLWLNLVTNGIQDWALAFEPGEDGVLRRRPRPPTQPIFDRLMIERTLVAALVMGGVGFAFFYSILPAGATPGEVAAAQNCLLLLMVLFENIHLGNCRSETRSAFIRSPLRSPILLAGALGAFGAHLAAMHWPLLQKVLGTAPVEPRQWITLAALAITIAIVMELHKVSWWWRQKNSPS